MSFRKFHTKSKMMFDDPGLCVECRMPIRPAWEKHHIVLDDKGGWDSGCPYFESVLLCDGCFNKHWRKYMQYDDDNGKK